jgi:hypothetical protein
MDNKYENSKRPDERLQKRDENSKRPDERLQKRDENSNRPDESLKEGDGYTRKTDFLAEQRSRQHIPLEKLIQPSEANQTAHEKSNSAPNKTSVPSEKPLQDALFQVPNDMGDRGQTFDSGQKKPSTSPISTSIAITQNDDPWASDLDDRLGANDEAKAFARLAVAKDFTPPLAIGLFGNWGSGKSFFMRLIYQHIERLSQGKPIAQAPESGSEAFHTDVVQIRFNAWHYAETNLWASLVSHLFIELDRWYTKHNPEVRDPLLEHLSTSRMLTLDAAQELVRRRREQRAASEQLFRAREELEETQANTASSPFVYLTAIRKVFGAKNPSDKIKKAKDEFHDAAEVLGRNAFSESCKGFQDISNALYSEAGRAKLLAGGYKAQLLSWKNVGAFIVITLSLPWVATEGMALLKAQLPFLENVRESFLLASVLVAGVTTRLRFVWDKVSEALKQLEAGKKALDESIESELAEQVEKFQVAHEKLARMNACVDEAKALVQVTSEQLALANHDFSQGTGAGRLKKFVRARATDGTYAQHLGLIATVRKDFEELAFNVAEAGSLKESVEAEREAFAAKMKEFLLENKTLLDDEDIAKLEATAEQPLTDVQSFKRIVLYIDDLDRCPPDKVVEVLQAVHLLLTFPLFVVMVAVDVRWVRQALLQHYPNLMGETGERQTASVSDYLEKIFQIPYWMRPMDRASSAQFLNGRLDRTKIPKSVKSTGSVLADSGGVNVPGVEDVTAQALNITPGETDTLQKLAPFIGSSPRRALRFLNVYRLIKASLKTDDFKALEGGEYKALLTLLAIAMGTPICFSEVLTSLAKKSGSCAMSDIKSLIPYMDRDDFLFEYERFGEILDVYAGMISKQKGGSKYQVEKYTGIIQRYSFDG